MTVTVTRDIVADVLKRVAELTKSELLIGIPDKNAGRKDDGAPITNAGLGYTHEFGSPAQNIPPRPFLIPGVAAVQGKLVEQLKDAGEKALTGKSGEIKKSFMKCGLEAVSSVQSKFHDGSMAPISEATKAARLRRKQAYKNASPKRRAKMMAKYLAGDFTPLIDTGQLLKSVTYIIKKKGDK